MKFTCKVIQVIQHPCFICHWLNETRESCDFLILPEASLIGWAVDTWWSMGGLAFPARSKAAFYCFHSKFSWQLAPSLWWSDTSCCAKASPAPCHCCTNPSILSVWGSVWTTILLHPQIILLLCLIHDGSTYILAGKRRRWDVCGMKLPAVPSMSCHCTSSLVCVTVSLSVVGPHLPRASLVWTLCQLHVGTDGSGGQMCRYRTSCSHYVLVSLT